jgi:hypothetical protein
MPDAREQRNDRDLFNLREFAGKPLKLSTASRQGQTHHQTG